MPERKSTSEIKPNRRMTRDERMGELTRRRWDMEPVAKVERFDVHVEANKIVRRLEEGLLNF